MSATAGIVDAAERDQALNPARSFIVQAPAGSGKTGLLIQRYLKLLAMVDEPEEILAITFTRKAAGEMRARIEKALSRARHSPRPDDPHDQRTYDLACEAVERDNQRHWALAEQPARLRISTIDSVNSRLSRRVPLSAGFTSHNAFLDDARPLYREAARETLALAEEQAGSSAAVRALLAHCDNNAGRVEKLLTTMLTRRDQWLEHTGSGVAAHEGDLRPWLEDTLAQLVERFLNTAHRAMPAEEADDIVACLAHASECLRAEGSAHIITFWADRTRMPDPVVTDLQLWKAVAEGFLTKEGSWRKTVDKRTGFPVDKNNEHWRTMKTQMVALLGRLQAAQEFHRTLQVVRALPEPRYDAQQWTLIEALWTVLPLSVGILKSLFGERAQTDYTEVAQEAVAALGVGEGVTELRLALDYQLKHILLDEFQDTSRSQYDLVKALTDGWDRESDRSLFLVGDPMQSIYRFREAEVGLFLHAWNDGIGDLELEPLTLQTNFRSDPAVIDWFNSVFNEVMPAEDDPAFGAVSFAPSGPPRTTVSAYSSEDGANAVSVHALPSGQSDAEETGVLRSIRETFEFWKQNSVPPDEEAQRTIGILVRSRKHAAAIAGVLRKEGIGYVATGLQQLHEQPQVQDLLALTRALTHLGDRLAWLACLRAPWCGLTLIDLHVLSARDHSACIWTLINDPVTTAGLSTQGQDCLERCRPVFQAALDRRGAIALRDLVENTWLRLGGPATIGVNMNERDFEPADLYLAFLGSLDVAADCYDGAELHELLDEHFITRADPDARVHIMTMHKAKGLEFDTVILPGLARQTRSSDKPLLLFDPFTRSDGGTGLIVAPIVSSENAGDPIYDLLWQFEKDRDRYEQDRLLYVAVTRARRRLDLFAQVNRDDDDPAILKTPPSNTLLSRLWPAIASQVDPALIGQPQEESIGIAWHEAPLRQLPLDWQLPLPDTATGATAPPRLPARGDEVEFEWASQWAKHVGSVVHRWLQHIAEEGIEAWNVERIATDEPRLRNALRRAGVARTDLDRACERTLIALGNTLADDHGQWMLSAAHADVGNELALTTGDGGRFANHVIDRTFVSADGTRWIIDYKTSTHEGSSIDAFLASEADRYRAQLRRYRAAFATLDNRPIRTALYFPLLQRLHEVDCDVSE